MTPGPVDPSPTPTRVARRSPPRRAAVLATVLVLVLGALGLLAGCGSDSPTSNVEQGSGSDGSGVTGTVTVFAAASLRDAFTDLAAAFEAANPGSSVELNFAASSTLAQQIQEGAPADVFASADQSNMQKVVDAGGIAGDPVVFATNSLQIIVAPGNPLGITGLADLAGSDVVYVTAAPEVPIGKYSAQVLENAGVTVSPASLEADVKAVVTKVTSGEADAAIVYATDVTAAGDRAEGVDIPTEYDVVAVYPAGATTEASNPAAAAAWIAFLTGDEGRAILAGYGFGAP